MSTQNGQSSEINSAFSFFPDTAHFLYTTYSVTDSHIVVLDLCFFFLWGWPYYAKMMNVSHLASMNHTYEDIEGQLMLSQKKSNSDTDLLR